MQYTYAMRILNEKAWHYAAYASCLWCAWRYWQIACLTEVNFSEERLVSLPMKNIFSFRDFRSWMLIPNLLRHIYCWTWTGISFSLIHVKKEASALKETLFGPVYWGLRHMFHTFKPAWANHVPPVEMVVSGMKCHELHFAILLVRIWPNPSYCKQSTCSWSV